MIYRVSFVKKWRRPRAQPPTNASISLEAGHARLGADAKRVRKAPRLPDLAIIPYDGVLHRDLCHGNATRTINRHRDPIHGY